MPAAATEANASKVSPRPGPSYLQMIVFSMNEAQKDLLPRKGISLRALKTKIAEKHTVTENPLNRSLHRALDEKVLISTKGVGLTGSVRFHPNFALKLKKLGDDPSNKEISNMLTKYLKTSHVRSSSDDSDDEKAAVAKKKQKSKNSGESSKLKSKKGETKSADSKPKAKKVAGEPALVTGKASRKRAAEKSDEEPKPKKSK